MSTENGSNRNPSHCLYAVIDIGGNDKTVWRPVGAAWPNRDGKGYSLQLDAVPLSGRLSMRVAKEKSERD